MSKQSAPAAEAVRQGEESIRVPQKRLDRLLFLAGQVIVHQARFTSLRREFENVDASSGNFRIFSRRLREIEEIGNLISTDVHTAVQEVRQVEIRTLFSRFPRPVRQIARDQGKNVDVRVDNGETLIDKAACENLVDPLLHMLRNSVDHGLENPEERKAAGKDDIGLITLSASNDRSGTSIRVRDDGRGLSVEKIRGKAIEKGLMDAASAAALADADVLELIFLPGFSTAARVTDISGRGVGMDVVRSNLTRLGGSAQIQETELGVGTTFLLKVPHASAVNIISGFVMEARRTQYVVPLSYVAAAIRIEPGQLRLVRGQEVLLYHDQTIPLLNLIGLAGFEDEHSDDMPLAVILRDKDRWLALRLEAFHGSQQIVLERLDDIFAGIVGVTGVSILGDARIALVLDPQMLFRMAELPRHEWMTLLAALESDSAGAVTGSLKSTEPSAAEPTAPQPAAAPSAPLPAFLPPDELEESIMNARKAGMIVARIDLFLDRDLRGGHLTPENVMSVIEAFGDAIATVPFLGSDVPSLADYNPDRFDVPFSIFLATDEGGLEGLRSHSTLSTGAIHVISAIPHASPEFMSNTARKEIAIEEDGPLEQVEGLQDFIVEAREHLSSLGGLIVALENKPDDKDTFDSVFRSFHTMKGMSGMLGFEGVAALCHSAEELLACFRDDKSEFRSTVDLLMDSLHVLDECMARIDAGRRPACNCSELLDRMDAIVRPDSGEPAETSIGGRLVISASVPIPLGLYDQLLIQKMKDLGRDVFDIFLELEEGSAYKFTTVFLILRELEERGRVLKTQPSIDILEEEKFDRTLRILFAPGTEARMEADLLQTPGVSFSEMTLL